MGRSADVLRERQKILMATIFTSDTGKSIMEITAIKVAINNLSHIGTEESILSFKVLFIDLFKCIFLFIGHPFTHRGKALHSNFGPNDLKYYLFLSPG